MWGGYDQQAPSKLQVSFAKEPHQKDNILHYQVSAARALLARALLADVKRLDTAKHFQKSCKSLFCKRALQKRRCQVSAARASRADGKRLDSARNLQKSCKSLFCKRVL